MKVFKKSFIVLIVLIFVCSTMSYQTSANQPNPVSVSTGSTESILEYVQEADPDQSQLQFQLQEPEPGSIIHAPTAELPDLTILSLKQRTTPLISGGYGLIDVKIANLGNVDTPNDVRLTAWVDGIANVSWRLDKFRSGEVRTVTVTNQSFYNYQGLHDVGFRVNSSTSFEEIDLTNNHKSKTMEFSMAGNNLVAYEIDYLDQYTDIIECIAINSGTETLEDFDVSLFCDDAFVDSYTIESLKPGYLIPVYFYPSYNYYGSNMFTLRVDTASSIDEVNEHDNALSKSLNPYVLA